MMRMMMMGLLSAHSIKTIYLIAAHVLHTQRRPAANPSRGNWRHTRIFHLIERRAMGGKLIRYNSKGLSARLSLGWIDSIYRHQSNGIQYINCLLRKQVGKYISMAPKQH